MQSVIYYLVMLLTGAMLHAQNTVEVTMTHFKSEEGKAHAALFNDASKFLKEGIAYQEAVIIDEEAVVRFTDIPDGVYAISCYHDEDSNGELNMRMGIIPSEPYGTSNNARGFMGPPKWKDAKFEVKNGEVRKLSIKVK